MNLHYNDDNSYLFVNEKEIIKFKAGNKNVNFPTQFCLGSTSDGFSATESTEISLRYLVGFRCGKKHFVKIVTSLVMVFLKMTLCFMNIFYLQKKTHYFKPI